MVRNVAELLRLERCRCVFILLISKILLNDDFVEKIGFETAEKRLPKDTSPDHHSTASKEPSSHLITTSFGMCTNLDKIPFLQSIFELNTRSNPNSTKQKTLRKVKHEFVRGARIHFLIFIESLSDFVNASVHASCLVATT